MKCKSVLKQPNHAPEIIEIEITENNICHIDTAHGTELNNMELSFKNTALQFLKLQNNIYAVSITTKGIYQDEEDTFSPYYTYPLEKNITMNDITIYGDVLVVGIYNKKVFTLSITEADKCIKLLNGFDKK